MFFLLQIFIEALLFITLCSIYHIVLYIGNKMISNTELVPAHGVSRPEKNKQAITTENAKRYYIL